MVVVLTHVCEGLHLFPWMHWGLEQGIRHYLDFWSAVLGFTLFPVGYLFHALRKRQAYNSLDRMDVLWRGHPSSDPNRCSYRFFWNSSDGFFGCHA